jgi:hypothetical protein
MVLRLLVILFVIYLGFRIARRFADWLLGPSSSRSARELTPRQRRRRSRQDIEDARWKDVS